MSPVAAAKCRLSGLDGAVMWHVVIEPGVWVDLRWGGQEGAGGGAL